MAKKNMSVKEAATALGVSPKWIRRRIAAGDISPARTGGKRNGRFILSVDDVETLRVRRQRSDAPAEPVTDALARIEQLEADRANLLAQVAWARAIAQEQQKALDVERDRVARLDAELAAQRERVERLKSLTVFDRLLGRHKSI